MRVTVSSRHTEVSDSLRAAAVEKIGRLQRFLEGMDSAEVHFSEEKNRRIADREICEVTLAGHGHHIRCKVAAPDGLAAVDLAVDKLEHQLHRLKTRLKGRSGAVSRRSGNGPPAGVGAGAGSVGPVDDGEDPEHSMADDAHITRDGTAIVKKKSFAMAPMAIDQAVLRLELLDHDFFLFTNAATGRSAVLYRRHEGGLGLIEQA
jgi:putative sigma-54 modulation protein